MQPCHIAGSTRSSSGTSSSWQPSDQRLYLVFRPADNEHLRPDMPHIGIPAFVDKFGGGSSSGVRAGDGDSCSLLSTLPEDALEGEEEGGASPHSSPSVAAAAPLYYFGFVQEAPAPAGRAASAAERQRQQQRAASTSDQLSEDGSALSVGAPSSQAQRSVDGAAAPDGMEESLGLQPVRF